jgi:phospholipid/cholesterol/gamma-HCH transport system substrate-binding protein
VTSGLRWTAVKLLVFTIVTIVTTTYLAAIIGNFRLFSQPQTIVVEFADATGLLRGDVVKAAGVTIGRVDRIEVVDGRARVTVSIDEGVELPADIGANIRFRNLVGQRMITLVPTGPPTTEVLPDGAVIPLEETESAFDLTELFNGLRPLIRSTDPHAINIVTAELTKALQGRSDEVEAIFSNIADVSDVLAARDQELRTLLDSLNAITGDLATRDAQLRATLADLNTFLAEVAASSADLESALVNLDRAAETLERIVVANDELITAEVSDLSDVLDAVNDKRRDLRAAISMLPEFTIAVERVTQHGEWANQHLINVCKDDFGTCGRRGTP